MQQNTCPKICLPITSSCLKILSEGSELLIKFLETIILISFKTKIFLLTPHVTVAATLPHAPLSLSTLQSKPNKLNSNSLQKLVLQVL